MPKVTQLLRAIDYGDPGASEELLPLVYAELRRLAASRMAAERSDHTLQATALVHEAYLRLMGSDHQNSWNSRAHFFGAAAEAMRRILVENARRKKAVRHGGELIRQQITLSAVSDEQATTESDSNILKLHDALEKLEMHDAAAAEMVRLRYFAGLTIKEAADVLQTSSRSANLLWAYARAWLRREIESAR